MDDVPERREDEATSVDPPAPRRETTGPATDRVRIVGAEPAGEITSELPVVSAEPDEAMEPPESAAGRDPDTEPEGYGSGQPMVRLTDEPADSAGNGPTVEPVTPGQTAVPAATPTELPHWTEPPTGQVPAVLARDTGDEPAESGMAAPSWREEDADWVAHDDQFEPSMFGSDQVALGSLDESDRSDAERRPWEFDLDSAKPGSPSPVRRPTGDDPAADVSPITEETEVVTPDREAPPAPDPVVLPAAAAPLVAPRRDEPAGPHGLEELPDRPAEAGSGTGAMTGSLPSAGSDPLAEASAIVPAAHAAAEGEELPTGQKRRPTGTARHGRSRRNGLRPTRLRAKKPEEVELTDPPLAAEPPGASVTDVPGAGRRRGLAGLAAADRTAERQDEELVGVGGAVGDTESGRRRSRSAVAAVGVAAGATKRRLARRPSEASPRPPGRGMEEATGGGPPTPRRPRPGEGAGPEPGPHEDSSSIGVRVGTGLAAAVVALLAFKVGTVASLVLSTIVVTFAAGECFGVLRRAGYHPATLLGLVGTVSLMIGAYTKGVAALPLVLVLLIVFTFIWYLFGIERGSPVAGTAATLLTVGWVSLLGAYAGLLLAPSAFPNRHGIAFLLGAIIATVANDIGALVIGGWLGSRPLAPNISPNKTWEGLFGGAVFSILVSTVVVGSIHPWSASNAALLGVVVAVVAPIGDLCESLLKRDLRLKDMGSLLPGHGGILDRVDALLFVLPATYYLVRALNIA